MRACRCDRRAHPGRGRARGAGYLDRGGGRFDPFYAGVNGASTPGPNTQDIVAIANVLAMIAAYLQEAPPSP
ncbi:hypothetical protein [Streptomyces sp. NPDC090021]|uniref:hypothetical protein n=1 Tax=Streptomyces sp. NPDC090021 TaxID=3365919 RepID=UPI0038185103